MSELQTLAEMTMLDASKCVFTPTEGGYLSLKYEDKEYEHLSEANEANIRAELTKLYYCPSITKILSVKDRMGYQYYEVITNAGKREFALRDASRNIRYVNPEKRGAVQIRDIDGNRYLIDDFDSFDIQSRKKIEAFLV